MEGDELSTIGPLTLIEKLPKNFLVMNGDILCSIDYGDFLKNHIKRSNEITVCISKRTVKMDYGVLEADANDKLISFKEKPAYLFDVSAGIYCISNSVVECLPVGKRYGFDNLMLDGISRNADIFLHRHDGLWLDIGRPDDYEFANNNYEIIKKDLFEHQDSFRGFVREGSE